MNDSEDLISKKELLETTGISYGQLYRWKRKGLIPESWFRKKSAFTGQETFFPRQEILERVERIKGMKEDVALSELADLLSPSPSGSPLGMNELIQQNIVSQKTFDLLQESAWENGTAPLVDPIPFGTAFHARLCEQLLEEGKLSREEILLAFHTLEQARGAELSDEPGELLLLRKSGVCFCLVHRGEAFLDRGTRKALEMDLAHALADFRWILKGERT
jgi:DNA-binding transcriptional MerR regulator